MLRKVLVYGLICVVVALGAVAYISGIGIGEFTARPAPATPPTVQVPPTPAFMNQDLAALEAEIEAAITADLPAIEELQTKRQWNGDPEQLIPSGKEAVTWKQAFEEYVDYRKRAVAAYRKGTQDPPAAREAAAAFLDSYSYAATWQRGDFKAIREQGDAALKAGSQDPLVVAYHTRTRHNLKEIQPLEAAKIYRTLKEKLSSSSYPPPLLRFLLSAWFADIAQTQNIPEATGWRMRQIAFEDAAKFLAQESGTANPAVLLTLVKNSLRYDQKAADQRLELFQACLSEKQVDPYIMHILGGEYYLQLAWDHRGPGYADKVSKDGWDKFHELLPRAARHFKRAWFLHPELPFAAKDMIVVSTAGGDESWPPVQWFHASVAAQLDYHDAYHSIMFNSMPRWGGSHRRVAEIAKLCVGTGRWDTVVPNEVETAAWMINLDGDVYGLVGKNPAVAGMASTYIEAFSAAKERGETKPEDFAKTLAEMTAILVQAGDFEQAKKAFAIGPEPNDWWWSVERGVGYRYSMGLASAITGPGANFVKSVHEFLTREAVEAPLVAEVEEMQKRLDDAKAVDSDPKAASYYDIAGRMLEQLRAYAAGDWVDLTFDPQMTLWMSRASKYDLIDPVTLRLTAKDQNHCIQLRPLTRFAPPYMVEAEVKFVSAVSGQACPGIVIGASQDKGPGKTPRPQLIAAAAGPQITAFQDYRQQKGQPSTLDFVPEPPPEDGFEHLGIRRYPGETQMFAMHGRLLVDRNDEPINDYIVFGDTEILGITGEAIFRNLRIRKAPAKVSNLDTESPESLPALREGVDYYPECPEARRLFAAALSEQGKSAEALEHLAKAKAVYTKISDLHRIEGVARCGVGEFQAALEAFREEYRLFPNASWPRIHEAWVLATAPSEQLRDGGKAQQLLEPLKQQMGSRADVWSFRITEAAVAAENGRRDEARELARQSEEMADTEYRREIAQRVRLTIDHDRPYRMAQSGEIPPPPAFPKRPKKPAPDGDSTSAQSAQ